MRLPSLLTTTKWIVQHPIARRQCVRSLVRYIHWQVASRLKQGPIDVPWVGGTSFAVKRGQTGVTGNIYAGLHEAGPMSFLLHYLRPGETFADIGANAGSYTLLALAAGARSIAVEPIPKTQEVLRGNLKASDAGDRVRVECCAIAAEPGVLRMVESDTTSHIADDGEIEVAVKTLDTICDDEVPALIKIDVEGHEMGVIEGGQATLRQCDALIVEAWGDTAQNYVRWDMNPLITSLFRAA